MDSHVIERLSDHLDGDLSAEDAATIEAHLQGCVECARVCDELKSVREAGASLPEWGPDRDLWPGILARVGASADDTAQDDTAHDGTVIDLRDRLATRPEEGLLRRHVRLTIPQLVAASVALMFLSGAGALAFQPAGPVATVAPGALSPVAQLVSNGGEIAGFDEQVAAFEAMLEEHREQLAENTVRILEKNLEIIDRAIDDSRRALERDPSSVFLQGHLAEALERKVGYLREAAQVVQAAT